MEIKNYKKLFATFKNITIFDSTFFWGAIKERGLSSLFIGFFYSL